MRYLCGRLVGALLSCSITQSCALIVGVVSEVHSVLGSSKNDLRYRDSKLAKQHLNHSRDNAVLARARINRSAVARKRRNADSDKRKAAMPYAEQKRNVRPLDLLTKPIRWEKPVVRTIKRDRLDDLAGDSQIVVDLDSFNVSKLFHDLKAPAPAALAGGVVPTLGLAAARSVVRFSDSVSGPLELDNLGDQHSRSLAISRSFDSIYSASSGNVTSGMHFVYVNGSDVPMLRANAPSPDAIPVWQLKQAISDAVEEGLRKAEDLAAQNHTGLSLAEVKKSVNDELAASLNSLQGSIRANKFKKKAWNITSGGLVNFFRSVGATDWLIFSILIGMFFFQHYRTLSTPSSKSFHGIAALAWISAAGMYNYIIFQRFGPTAGILWLNGYILELVFLIENVLVCHVILQAFRTPKWVNEKALFLVVVFRMVYQMIFYMGLAELVFSGQVLPYVLGLWLLYAAFQSALDDGESNFDIMDTRVVYLARAAFGDRLSLTKDDNGAMFVTKGNRVRLSLVGLMVFCLICVDCLLYVDVAITKIEELQGNAFLCFSSAIAASVCMPELVFVMRDMFRRFPGLKYGISAVLVYIGLQMLLHQVWWPPICMDLVIWVSLLILSTALPDLSGSWRSNAPRSVDMGTQACYVEPKNNKDAHDVEVQ